MSLKRLEEDFINIAVTPFLTWLERFNDGMLGAMEMLGRVFIL